ncbi:hypothetical protein RhiirC2_771844 [Rhizophagus irregularis]|uniref:Uncharacterized protein n=1 Tax=Rhizophagus irregularis TaxID=588596 RepID=A0A2N1NSY3_9GLOM|nr:hypothetical protein RhiirC2_771844 [Rhizophagus irregularis]
MVKSSRQKFKQKLRKSITTPAFRNNYIPADQKNHDESTNQVSTLLDKLRKEARFNNGTASANISSTLPQPAFNYLMREHAEREQQERGEREAMRQRVSGPAPPKSWQKARKGKNESIELLIKDRKEKRRAWDGPTLPMRKTLTLLEICSKTVAINIKSYISYPYFANMPTHLKQCILSSLSIYNPLTEEILPLFNTDTEYEELDLANSTINLESFKKSFWKIVEEKDLVDNLVKNWEDLADQDEETDIIYSRIFGKPMDITNDDDDSKKTNKLISKLPKLRKLNLGFTHNISGIPLSILLVATLPLLTHLSIAGCFNREDGPHSLRILSGLINLLVLDISYCEWATDQILLQFINWDRDLKSLRVLVAVNCGSWKDAEVVRKKLSENRRSFELWTEQ